MKEKKKNKKTIDIASKEDELVKTYATDNIKIENSENVKYPEPEIIQSFDINDKKDRKKFKKTSKKAKKNKKPKNIMRIVINTIFTLIMIIMVLVLVDVICITKYNVGPFFAIPTKTYKDGGTKEYYGLGYKVIKYHQVQGRRDTEIGYWSLKYNVEPITFQDLDLAIEMNNNSDITYQKYDKKFIRVISTLKKVDSKKHQITMGYKDEDGKYSLDIVCDVVKEQKDLGKLEKDKEITVIGTLDNYKHNKVTKLHMSNCFAEQ